MDTLFSTGISQGYSNSAEINQIWDFFILLAAVASVDQRHIITNELRLKI